MAPSKATPCHYLSAVLQRLHDVLKVREVVATVGVSDDDELPSDRETTPLNCGSLATGRNLDDTVAMRWGSFA
jgi:hypothetical protein